MNRTVGTAIVFCLFLISMVLYLYTAKYIPTQPNYLRLWWNSNIAYAVISIWLIEKRHVKTFLQESLLNGQRLLLCLAWIDAIFTNFGLISNPYTNLIIFCLGAITAVAVLLYEMIKPTKWQTLLTAIGLAILLFLFLVR